MLHSHKSLILRHLWHTSILTYYLCFVSPPGFSCQASTGRLMFLLRLCYFLSCSFIIFFFNNGLEQRDLKKYKTDLH